MILKNTVKIIFAILGIALIVYLILPEPLFPSTLWDFVSSTEPADKETPLRRGYFTDLTREQLMSHYVKEFGWGVVLNYPPENAQTLIRDQTKATYLEEVVHPMRESIYIAGNIPQQGKENFRVNGVQFNQKVIIKYVGSNIFVRLLTGIATLWLIWMLGSEWVSTIKTTKWNFRL